MNKKEMLAEEVKETPEEEKAESAKEQAKEKKEGTEIHGSEGVIVPEKFQQFVHAVMKEAKTKHHLNHISDRVNTARDEMFAKEQETKSKKSKGPAEFSTADMPE